MEKGWEEAYYLNQAGTGFAPYAGLRYQRGNGFTTYRGIRYQRGNGFLGRIWKGVALPLLKYIGRHGIEAAGNIVREANDDNVKEIVKREALKLAGKAAADGGKRLSTYIQTGKGLTHIAPKVNKRRKQTQKRNKRSVVENNSKRISHKTRQSFLL